ncbi:RNA-binding protein [Candidatus Bathyarchaeota archaeon]|nr:RNA-binding protein [Candidatus Bathyarchaeota archaeon]
MTSKSRMNQGKADLQIGKRGINDGFIIQLRELLKQQSNVKVRVLKNARSSKEDVKRYAQELAKELSLSISALRGNTFVLERT